MSANVVFSQLFGGRAVVRVNANCTINVAANSTVNSDISSTNDPITGAAITKVIWSTPNNIAIKRGANTILTLNGSGNWDLKGMGVSLSEFNAAPISVVMVDANSSLLLECTKVYPTGSE